MIDREVDHKNKMIHYFISDILIPEQTVTGQTVETDGNMLLKLAFELRERHGLMVRNTEGTLVPPVDEEGNRIPPRDEALEAFNLDCSRMAVWCHSHVQMACNPSGTDNEQWKDWIARKITEDNPSQPVMMVILNQKDEYFCRLYDPVLGAEVQNATFHISDGFDFAKIDTLLKERIKTRVHTSTAYTGGSNNSNGTKNFPVQGQTHTGGKSQDSTTKQTGQNTSIKDGFILSWVAPSYPTLSECAEAITNAKTLQASEVPTARFMKEMDQYFGDPDSLEAKYCWKIMSALLFEEDKNDVPTLYAFKVNADSMAPYKDAREDFRQLAIGQDTFGADLFVAAAEIAFGYKLSERMPGIAKELDNEWMKLFLKNVNAYENKNKNKNKKSRKENDASAR
jgi:hypothetical protein